MEEPTGTIYTCRSRHSCLREWVDCYRPEPFIGSLRPRIALIGANPSSYEWNQRIFKDVIEYRDYHEQGFFEGPTEEEWLKRWPRGYLQAYRMLINNPNARLKTDFNENAVLLNIIKCSTRVKLSELRQKHKREVEQAKANCIIHLIRQLENMRPPVVLSHGRYACNAIIEMLRERNNYKADTSSSDLDDLSKLSMNDLPSHWVLARNDKGLSTLFLFSKHLSVTGSAVFRLKQNLEKKKALVKLVLKES